MPGKAPLTRETITVEAQGQWGPKVNGVYYGFNEPLRTEDFPAGFVGDVLVKTMAPSAKYPEGKKYIAQIISSNLGGGAPAAPAPAAPVAAKPAIPAAPAVAPKASEPKASTPAFKARDFDAEARGKTRCVQFEAALMSPAIATLAFKNIEELLVIVRKAADDGVAYTFEEKK
jgi:hypothetical protein